MEEKILKQFKDQEVKNKIEEYYHPDINPVKNTKGIAIWGQKTHKK